MTQLERKKLGLLDCIMILVGGMIGSAIFSLSGLTYVIAGGSAILSWIIGGIILLMYGFVVAELCTIYPGSGGIFIFPHHALFTNKGAKEGIGWAAAWSLLNVNIFGAAFSAIYVVTYLSQSFPALGPYRIPLAVVWCLACGALCLMNITVAGKVNLILTGVLLLGMLLFSVISFFSGGMDLGNFVPFFTRGTGGGSGFISAIPTAMLAYGAIISVAFMMGQVKDPEKTVPKSMKLASIVSIGAYLIVFVALVGMLAVEVFTAAGNEWTVYAPLYAVAAFKLSSIPWLHFVVSIAATMALTTTLLVLMMTAGWTVQAVAAHGLLPKPLAKVSDKTGTPIGAMLSVIAFTTIVACFPSLTEQIVNCGAITNAISIVILSIALLKARQNHVYQAGAFRAPGGALMPVVLIILLVIFILPGVFQPWSYWAIAGGWYALGLAIFVLMRVFAKSHAPALSPSA